MPRKLIGWALLALAMFYLVSDPHGAAQNAHHMLAGLGRVAHGITAFMSALGSNR